MGRWGPLVVVVVAFALVVVAIGAAVYVGKVTEPRSRAGAATPRATGHVVGRRCIGLDLTAVGAPAVKVAGTYRLRVLVGDNGSSCVLRPSAVSLVAQGAGGAHRTFAVPAAAVRAGPAWVVDYEVAFARSCTVGRSVGRSGSVDVLLSVGGSLLDVSGATMPAGLERCRRVRMAVSSYR